MEVHMENSQQWHQQLKLNCDFFLLSALCVTTSLSEHAHNLFACQMWLRGADTFTYL